MAKDASNDLTYFLSIDASKSEDLASIRHWSSLKLAFEENLIWVKDLDYSQLNSLTVKSIPFHRSYEAKDGKLFPLNSLLPERTVPGLLWTPIERALPVELPDLNHNYFGFDQTLSCSLVKSEAEQSAIASLHSLDSLLAYATSAPEIRMKNLEWVILSDQSVLVYGKPLLPLSGNDFWLHENHLLPAGTDFELPILSEVFYKALQPETPSIVLWKDDAGYQLIPRSSFQQLSLSSIRLTIQSMKLHHAE